MVIVPEKLHELCLLSNSQYGVDSVQAAYHFAEKIAKTHYENFIVGSVLIPSKISKYFYAIYAFARVGDDIADELTKKQSAEYAADLLQQYKTNLHLLHDANVTIKNPIFIALKDTIEQNNIDITLFDRLISAFYSDIYFSQPNTFNDLFAYCAQSANPVGELILTLFKENTEQAIHYSDCVCTALQLINFWQDLSVDTKRNRCYIPANLLSKKNADNYYDYFKNIETDKLQNILQQCYDITNDKLNEGKKILYCVKNIRLKLELYVIIFMAKRMLTKIMKLKHNIINTRPSF